MKIRFMFPLWLVALCMTACSTPTTTTPIEVEVPVGSTENVAQPNNKPLRIVTSFAPLYQHTLNLVDDNDIVTNLVPAGTSVHTRQPTPQDIVSLEQADMVIVNGLDLEEFLEEYLDDLEQRGVTIIDTSTDIETREFDDNHDDDHDDDDHDDDDHDDDHDDDDHDDDDHDDDDHDDDDHDDDDHDDDDHDDDDHDHHHHTGTDPHIWLNIANAQQQTDTITQALIAADPGAGEYYKEQNTIYQEKLATLDSQITKRIQGLDIKPFVVFHDAYGYYLDAYDLSDKQVDMIVEHHNDTPTQADIATLIKTINSNGVATVFVEPQFNPTIVQALQQETDITIGEIDPIGSQMDADGYLANMKALTDAFVQQ